MVWGSVGFDEVGLFEEEDKRGDVGGGQDAELVGEDESWFLARDICGEGD